MVVKFRCTFTATGPKPPLALVTVLPKEAVPQSLIAPDATVHCSIVIPVLLGKPRPET
jgi:hypothetical protein